MNRNLLAVSLLALSGILVPVVSSADASDLPKPAASSASQAAQGDDDKYAAQLQEGAQLIKAGQPGTAISKFLDPLIAHFEASYPSSGEKIYCVRSQPEALLYMLESAQANRPAKAIDITWAAAYDNKGYALIELGAIGAARESIQKAVTLSPMNSLFLSELGYTYQVDKSWDLALSTFVKSEEAAKLSPEDQVVRESTRALRGQGYVLVELGRLDEAAAAYKKALTLDANDKASQGELGYVESLKAKQAAAAASATH